MEASRTQAMLQGLRSNEVEARRARGEVNVVPDETTRSIGEIVRANVFTPFNFLLGGLLVVILIVGPLNDALFGGVIIANTAIGVIQEIRAKRTLDRLSLLSSPRAVVHRDGTTVEIMVNEIVLDDVIALQPGSQIPVDGDVIVSKELEVDESLLTGESDAIVKQPGDHLLSGSFVAAGSGVFQATRVGVDAYAATIAADAKRFTLARSELRSGIDLIIKLVGFLMIPTGILLLVNQLRLHSSIAHSIGGTVAGLVAMVPEGLVLLTSIAFAASVVRLGRRRVLVQELPAVETLARVDVVCLDKTGTLTRGDLLLAQIVPGPGVSDDAARQALASLVVVEESPNATLRALARGVVPDLLDEHGAPHVDHEQVVAIRSRLRAATPFSSTRKWSAATFQDGTTWILGAPDVLLHNIAGAHALSDAVQTYAQRGQRVLLLATATKPVEDGVLPSALTPYAIALLEDQVRDDAHETLRFFAEQNVLIKIISGDHPATVAAVARRAGLEVDAGFDAANLPEDESSLADTVEAHTVFGRVKPAQKRAMVRALQARQHVVAMTGDGVNDVLALKDADIGISMGSGADATRAAAQLVLLDNDFAALPPVVAEGRQVIANIERVANLFLTKTVYAMLLALAVGVAGMPYPFLPRHLTLVGSLTIGIPAFFLALAPNSTRAQPHFVARVMRFAAPAGLLCASATFGGYYLAHVAEPDAVQVQQTAATLVLVALGLLILIRLTRPVTGWRTWLIVAMIVALGGIVVLPAGRSFFALEVPDLTTLVALIGIIALSWWVMELASRLQRIYRRPYERLLSAQEKVNVRETTRRTTTNTVVTEQIAGQLETQQTKPMPVVEQPTQAAGVENTVVEQQSFEQF